MIGPAAQDRGKEELEERIGDTDEREVEIIVNSILLTVKLKIGQHDAEADKIDKNNQKYSKKACLFHRDPQNPD